MEILQFLISFLSNEFGIDLSPILNSIKNNGFDIKSILSEINPQTIEKVLGTLGNIFKNQNPTNFSGDNNLLPISSFADDITVSSLNEYFSEI
jgi:hypothetical protein